MEEKIAKLIDVKSIVTLVMTLALVVLLFSAREPSKELLALYCTSYGAIITYFFTRPNGGGPSAPAVTTEPSVEGGAAHE